MQIKESRLTDLGDLRVHFQAAIKPGAKVPNGILTKSYS